jgi:hypothetical protein
LVPWDVSLWAVEWPVLVGVLWALAGRALSGLALLKLLVLKAESLASADKPPAELLACFLPLSTVLNGSRSASERRRSVRSGMHSLSELKARGNLPSKNPSCAAAAADGMGSCASAGRC